MTVNQYTGHVPPRYRIIILYYNMSLVRSRVIHTKAPVNGKVSILLFMFCCCFKERTRSRRRDEKNNSGHDSSSLSVSASFGVCRLYILYILYLLFARRNAIIYADPRPTSDGLGAWIA